MIRALAVCIIRAGLEAITARLAPPRTFHGTSGLYLSRWTLVEALADGPLLDGQTEPLPRWRICLHHFHRSDEDRALHTHPWRWGVALQLAGGYREERRADDRVVVRDCPPGTVVTLGASTAHRVDLLDEERGAWSLIVTGPLVVSGDSVGSWGFVDRETWAFTPWREFIRAKGLVPHGGGGQR